MRKRTLEGIPIITKKTYQAFVHEFNRDFSAEGGEDYLEKRLEEIYLENPLFYRFIKMFAGRFPEYENLNKKSALSLLSAYRLLKLQAGNEMIDKTWFPKECVVEGISLAIPSKLIEFLGWEEGDDLEGELKDDSFILKRKKNSKNQ